MRNAGWLLVKAWCIRVDILTCRTGPGHPQAERFQWHNALRMAAINIRSWTTQPNPKKFHLVQLSLSSCHLGDC